MAVVQWALFNQINQHENVWFFGRYILVHISCVDGEFLQVEIPRILQHSIDYFPNIHRLPYGDLKWSIHSLPKLVRVH